MDAEAVEEVVIGPNDGPQTEAFASTADITVYGGAAGGGKTWLALLRMGVHADTLPGYNGIIFRRKMPNITTAGGVWEESNGLYPMFGADSNISNHFWRFRERSMIQFRSIQLTKDTKDYRSAQLAEFCFEEATEFEEPMFWAIFSRLRTPLRKTHGFKARCMLTCNPDPDSWVRRLIDWWIGEDGLPILSRAGKKRYFARDGDAMVWGSTPAEVRKLAPHLKWSEHNQPKSIRFIPAKLSDNPQGDPSYESRLNALPLIERSQLLGGNWNIRAHAGSYFKRGYFKLVEHAPGKVKARVRAWDLAATEPSEQNPNPAWTVGVLLAQLEDGTFCVEHVERARLSPGKVDDLILKIAEQDGIAVKQCFWQDPGQAGKSQVNSLTTLLRGFSVKTRIASEDKETYAGPVSSAAEHGKIVIRKGAWNDAFFSVLEGFPTAAIKDDVDALSRGYHELVKPAKAPVPFTHSF